MISESLSFIVGELNNYFILKGEVAATIDAVTLGNIARANESSTSTGAGDEMDNRVVVTMVNIEEDRVSKSPINFSKVNDKIIYKNPKIPMNLYCLFAVNHDYTTSLRWLAHVVRFFQYRNVFTPQTSPALNNGIEKLIFDLYNMNFEQVNHLWGTLGGKYLPSVMYKMRLVMIEEDTMSAQADPISGMDINANNSN
jgi:Pvc16 N-terminal domain